MAQDQRPAPATSIRGVNRHQRGTRDEDRQGLRQRDHSRRQLFAAEDLHRQDVKTNEQEAAANNRGEPNRRHGVTAEEAASPDQVGDQRPLAVIAPVEMARPVPVVGFIGGQVERAMMIEIGEMQAGRRQDEKGGEETPGPGV